MIPTSINHHNLDYCLAHLQPSTSIFRWICKDGRALDFTVNISWSNHCISDTLNDHEPEGAWVFSHFSHDKRIFDVDRYNWSLELPNIIDGLFQKPTSMLILTVERNWSLFRLKMRHPLDDGSKYYCFVRLRYVEEINGNPLSHLLSLHVESAYARTNEPLTPHGNERTMFGRIAERLEASRR